ncbi:hypothetical protein XELAEV_18014356mg [Xenopus laevis]|uniref:Uncharacterized protein n=1 Tax=Xenopus laevis TaxID=8355 RepID=A0A974DHS0_XENLA|nr:hypothetical protein XELAEV_18014356mg [Xenopus laevis]
MCSTLEWRPCDHALFSFRLLFGCSERFSLALFHSLGAFFCPRSCMPVLPCDCGHCIRLALFPLTSFLAVRSDFALCFFHQRPFGCWE